MIWRYLLGEDFVGCFVVAAAVVGFGVSFSYGVDYLKDITYDTERCRDSWTKHNVSSIRQSFREHLYGQHLVDDVVPNLILNHVSDVNPKKALVLSFHGWTGCGKNFVSDIITRHLYFKGTESEYVHKKIAGKDYKHVHRLQEYRKELEEFIVEKTKLCSRNLFIFDEVEKMPWGLLDVLQPYLDFHPNVDKVDYRKNIFIFLSNLGGKDILDASVRHRKSEKRREEITTKSMENLLRKVAFNEKGGLKHAQLLTSALIDFQIPFLPLERRHVEKCIVSELKRLNKAYDRPLVEKIADELNYFPKDDPVFSETGCKHVMKKVAGFA